MRVPVIEPSIPRNAPPAIWLGRGFVVLFLSAVVAIFLLGAAARTEDASPTDYQVKAAFLFYFAKFVEWPPAKITPRGTVNVCVLGDDPFGIDLDRTIEGKDVNGRKLVIRRIDSIPEIEPCHIVFVSSSERKRVSDIVAAARPWHVLTVGEMDEFAKNGGMIEFILEQKKVRFEINALAADAGKLKISSQLLKLARVVE